MSVTTAPAFEMRLLHPRYWLWWVAIAILLPLAFLPWSLQLPLGKALGRLGWMLARKRRRDTLINLALCFPELNATERRQWSLAIFQNAMLGFLESLSAWYAPKRFERQVTISGLHHLVLARQESSVLLLGAHYTLLDLGGYLATRFFPASIVYRPQNNALLEWLITRARAPLFVSQIDHDDMRGLVKQLKTRMPQTAPDQPALGHVVWYTPDQDFGLKQGVMAPFFGVSAATLTAQRRLARLPDVKVLAIHFARVQDQPPRYHIHITPVLADFPSSDEATDAARTNELLEQLIRQAPTQYMWFHRRFKTRPDGLASPYQNPALYLGDERARQLEADV